MMMGTLVAENSERKEKQVSWNFQAGDLTHCQTLLHDAKIAGSQ